MKLSILIPVYNERPIVRRALEQVLEAPLPEGMERELIIVDDCSTDGTYDILKELAARHDCIRLFRHEVNLGKGAAIRSAVKHATGDFCIIQDADLEYDPREYPKLLKPLLDGNADVVYGSRYLAGEQRRVLPFWHTRINKFLTTFSNMFSNLDLTDMETCYKVFRTDLLKSIPIRSNRFGFEPEITMKCAKRLFRIYEVPISYHGRTYEEGKKIGWKDGFQALYTILKFWLIDDLYVEPYGRAYLNNLTGTPRYLDWMTTVLRPHAGDRVLEVGAGIGNLTARLQARRMRYVACEKDPLYLHALRNRYLRTPNVVVRPLDPDCPEDFKELESEFDTVYLVNVLEYVQDPRVTLRAAVQTLAKGGRVVVLVPQGRWLWGTLDEKLGHRRRFEKKDIHDLFEQVGVQVETTHELNRVGTVAWLVFGKLLRRRTINKVFLKLFDKTVWLWRLLNPLMPWPGLSLVVVGRKGYATRTAEAEESRASVPA